MFLKESKSGYFEALNVYSLFKDHLMDYLSQLQELLLSKEQARLEDLIVQHPAVLDATNEQGQSGFMLIAYSFQSNLLQKAQALKKAFTLYEAVVAGRLAEVQQIITAQPSLINEYSPDGFTAISLAAYLGQKEVVDYLLQHNADPNKKANNGSKVNALHAALAYNDTGICELLLKHGANVNMPQSQGIMPLHSAAHRGNLEMVKLLVRHQAAIQAKTQDGKTALDFAEKDEHQEVVAYLQSL